MIATSKRVKNPFLADVLAGLDQPQKRLSPKYFYDEAGSRLFDRITRLGEYYPTRTELGIMRTGASEMARLLGSYVYLIELGGGSLVKVRLLLDRLENPAAYVPVDVSGAHLKRAAAELTASYPGLPVIPVVADFTRDFPLPDLDRGGRRVVYFPGSTIGNFDPPEAASLLRRVVTAVRPGGGLLLGVDLKKERAVVELAYNDPAGVTAAFNLNLLVRINRELGADFNLAAFKHSACYNTGQSRIEMHLVSLIDQVVTVAGCRFSFRTGETIHTENSYKYDNETLAGWRPLPACVSTKPGPTPVTISPSITWWSQAVRHKERTMPKATWNGAVIAESTDTVVVEGNHYFPADAVKQEYIKPSSTHTVCGWKGTASYFTLIVDGKENPDAAWYYPEPKEAAKEIAGRVAFWKGVAVSA